MVRTLIENSYFLLGIISGFIASMLYNLFVKLINTAKNNSGIISVVQKSKIGNVYKNQSEAADALYSDAKDSEKLYIFASFGGIFAFKEVYEKVHSLLNKADCDIRFMLLDPDSDAAKLRAKELNMKNISERINHSKSEIEQFKHVKIALHNETLRFIYYVFDDVLYLGFRLDDTDKIIGLKDKFAPNTQMFRIKKGSYIYSAFIEQFIDDWKKYYKE